MCSLVLRSRKGFFGAIRPSRKYMEIEPEDSKTKKNHLILDRIETFNSSHATYRARGMQFHGNVLEDNC